MEVINGDPEMTGTSSLNPESFVEAPDSEAARTERLRVQRAADREARRAAHVMATSGSLVGTESAGAAPDDAAAAALAAATFPTELVAAPTAERYPDIDLMMLDEDIKRNHEKIAGWEKRASNVVDLLAEVQSKIDAAAALDDLEDVV